MRAKGHGSYCVMLRTVLLRDPSHASRRVTVDRTLQLAGKGFAFNLHAQVQPKYARKAFTGINTCKFSRLVSTDATHRTRYVCCESFT